jgi:site-specific DNA-methyltransferase (adenine-specific)
MNKNQRSVLFSSKSDNWATPQWLFDKLNKTYNFTLDPCASQDNAKCSKFYTEEDNGLTKSFQNETVFINPPYSKTYDWVSKAYHEAFNDVRSIVLVPARMDSRWFHEFCFDPFVCKSITFIRGRLKFGGSKNSAPFPSIILEFGPPSKMPQQPQIKSMANK